jgi:hypothetical protein
MATPINVNPSPKVRFQESAQNISKHRDMIQTAEFQRACDYSLMQMQWILAQDKTDSFNAKAANQLKMDGVLEYLAIFRTLGEQPQAAPRILDTGNLAHLP